MYRRVFVLLLGIFSVSAALGAASAEEAPFPVTLEQWLGEVTIPAPPQRIVALGQSDMDAVFALGLTPVAGVGYPYSDDGVAPWLKDHLASGATVIAPLTAESEVSLEWVVAQKPDLILATGYWNVARIYEQLSQIAPTVAGVNGSLVDTWEEQVSLIGKAVGKSAEAEALIEDTHARIAAVKDRFPAMAGKTFSLSYMYSTSEISTLFDAKDAAVRFFGQLGLSVTPQLAALADTSANSVESGVISLERLDMLEADVMVVAYDTPEYRQTLEASPLFRQLSAVKAGHYSALDLTTVAELRVPTVLGLVWAVERLEPILEGVFGS